MEILKKKSVIAYLVVIVVGVTIISLMFVYYGLNLGIKPCEGLPSDAANCGDGDFGGVYFLLIGVPIAAVGLLGLATSLFQSFRSRSRR